MNELPLNALRAFAQIYESGGIRSAARKLGISHSAVSRHLKELEAWLGIELVDKSGGRARVEFTAEGRTLGARGLRSLSDLADVVETLRERRTRNAITVDTTPSIASRWLLPRLADFEVFAPGAAVSIVVDQQVRAPGENGRDVAIRMGDGRWEDGVCTLLGDDTLKVVAHPRYLKRKGRPKTPNDLHRYMLLHDSDPNASWTRWRDEFCSTARDMSEGRRFSSSDLVIRAAENGLGLALAYGRLVEDSLRSETLIEVFPDLQIRIPNAYWAVTPPGFQRKPVRRFLDWLHGSFA